MTIQMSFGADIARRGLGVEFGGQHEARLGEFEPQARRSRIVGTGHIATPAEIGDQPLVAQTPQGCRGGNAARPEGARHIGLPQHEPGRQPPLNEVLAQHAMDRFIERGRLCRHV